MQLATGKSLVLGGLAVAGLVAAAASAAAEGQGIESLRGGWHEPAAWAALLWAGLGPGAVASYLHIMVRAAYGSRAEGSMPYWYWPSI